METEKNKRAREEDSNGQSPKTNAKKRNVEEMEYNQGGESATGTRSPNSFAELDVFDFPWLKDSLICKSEDWKFEDIFFTSPNGTAFAASLTAIVDIKFSERSFCLSPPSLLDLPAEDFEENVWQPFEGEGLGLDEEADSIWSSALVTWPSSAE